MAKSSKSKPQGKNSVILGAAALDLIPASEIELLRRGVFNVVKQNVPRVREVLTGTRQWNPQQVKLYLALLDKVMPDLNHSYHQHDHKKSLDELSVDELRRIAAQEVSRLNAVEAMPCDDPDIPLEAQAATLLTSPLMPDPE